MKLVICEHCIGKCNTSLTTDIFTFEPVDMQLGQMIVSNFNPFLASGFVHPYHLDESIPSLRGLYKGFHFSLEISVSKKCRP